MSDSYNKIFVWQIGLAAVVGIIWALLWELNKSETGFFFDLPWGMFIGYLFGLIVLAVVVAIGAGIWALVRQLQKPEAGVHGAMSSDLDGLAASGSVTSITDTLDSWNASPVAWAVAWGAGVAFAWGMVGGFAYRYDNFGVAIIITLVFGIGGALAITGLFKVTETLAGGASGGYSWMDGVLTSMRTTWDSWGLAGKTGLRECTTWGFAAAVAWGVAGFFAAAGMGAGIGQAITLAIVTLILTVAAGIVGVQMRLSMDEK